MLAFQLGGLGGDEPEDDGPRPLRELPRGSWFVWEGRPYYRTGMAFDNGRVLCSGYTTDLKTRLGSASVPGRALVTRVPGPPAQG